MKRVKLYFKSLLWLAAFLFVTGFGDVNVYQGIVSKISPNGITILTKSGGQRTFKIDTQTKTFVSGRVLPATRIKPNSHVEVAVNSDDVCLQIVVQEGPK